MVQLTDPKSSNINKKVRIYGYILLFISLGFGLAALIPMLHSNTVHTYSDGEVYSDGGLASFFGFVFLFPICLLFLIAGLAVLSKANRKY